MGLAAEQGPDFSGEVCVAPLGAPDAFFDQFEEKASTSLNRQPYHRARGLRTRAISVMYW